MTEAGQDELAEAGNALSEDIDFWYQETQGMERPVVTPVALQLDRFAAYLEDRRTELAGKVDSEAEWRRQRILRRPEFDGPQEVVRVRGYQNPIANAAVHVVSATQLAAEAGYGPARLVYRKSENEIECLYNWCLYFLDRVPTEISGSENNHT